MKVILTALNGLLESKPMDFPEDEREIYVRFDPPITDWHNQSITEAGNVITDGKPLRRVRFVWLGGWKVYDKKKPPAKLYCLDGAGEYS